MATHPTLESFSQINYNGTRPITQAEIEVYRASFLPIFNRMTELQKQRAGSYKNIQQAEGELQAAFNNSVRYEVGLFSLKLRNDETGAIACEAQVTINAPAGSWSKNILYSLENTTDERLTTASNLSSKRLDKFLTMRREEDPDGLLFVMSDGSKLITFIDRLNAALRDAGIEQSSFGERYTVYSLRHFYVCTYGRSKSAVHE